MTHFMNKKEDLVTEAIDGALTAAGGTLSRLDGYPHIRVVVRSELGPSQRSLSCRAAVRATNRPMWVSSARACSRPPYAETCSRRRPSMRFWPPFSPSPGRPDAC